MKKFLGILAVMMIVSMMAATAFAADAAKDEKKMPETLKKAYEKSSANASYTLESVAKMNGQEFKSSVRAYFKDTKNYRMDTEAMGQKTRIVVTPAGGWSYIEATKMLMVMDKLPESVMERKDIEYTEGKEGDFVTYSYVDPTTKFKITVTIDPKESLPVKMATVNDKGETVSTMTYKDWKFEKIEDSMFARPEGAQEVKMPAMPPAETK